MNKIIPILLIGIILIGTTPAFAHKLLANDPDNNLLGKAVFIPDPFNHSYFTLEKFDIRGESHWYQFFGKEGQIISIRTLVPDIESSSDFTPSFALIHGTEKITQVDTTRTQFHEETTNTDWFVTAHMRVELPETGIYFIRVHDELHHYSQGDTGKFSLEVGEIDELDLGDYLQLPYWILLVNMFFENFVFVWIMLSFLFAIVVIVFVMINRRGKKD